MEDTWATVSDEITDLRRRVERLELTVAPPWQDEGVAARTMALAEKFAGLALALPQVQQVLLEETEEGAAIWTIIDAAPFDSTFREPVYAAEAEALRSIDGGLADFRLLNTREYEPAQSDLLPKSPSRVWNR